STRTANTQCSQTVIPPGGSPSPATTGGPTRRSAALRAIGGGCHETLHSEVRDERRRNRHGAVGLLPRFEERRDGAWQRHARRVERMRQLGLRARRRAVADVGTRSEERRVGKEWGW